MSAFISRRPVARALRALALAGLSSALLAACGGAPDLGPVDRSQPPAPAKARAWAPPEVQTFKLKNGLEVWHVEQRQTPLIAMRLLLPNGASSDPAEVAGLSSVTIDMLDEGAGTHDALALAEAFQRLATDYSAAVATDVTEFSLSLLADNLEPSLKLLADILMRPRFDAGEFERRKAQRLAAALASESEPGNAANLVGRAVLYGQGYGGLSPNGTRRTLEGVTLDAVKTHFARLVAPQGAVLVVVGAVDHDQLAKTLEATLGGWKGHASLKARPLTPAVAPPGIYAVDFPGASQTTLTVLRRAEGTRAGDDFPAKVFNWSLGGAFTSRLNLNLREEKGYTYGARSGYSRWQDAGVFSLGAQVKAETTRASLDEVFKELREISGGRPISAEEHGQAVGGLLKGFPSRFEEMQDVAAQLGAVFSDARTPEWFRQWPEKLGAVTLAQANAVAKAQAGAGDYVVVLAGDLSQVGPSLASLNLPIQLFDAQAQPLGPWTPPAIGTGAKPAPETAGTKVVGTGDKAAPESTGAKVVGTGDKAAPASTGAKKTGSGTKAAPASTGAKKVGSGTKAAPASTGAKKVGTGTKPAKDGTPAQ